jgi:hypothetical protein
MFKRFVTTLLLTTFTLAGTVPAIAWMPLGLPNASEPVRLILWGVALLGWATCLRELTQIRGRARARVSSSLQSKSAVANI